MTTNMAVYMTLALLTVWGAIMVIWAMRSKKHEYSEFSFFAHFQNMKISAAQYEKLTSDARILMYLYVLVFGVELGKGNVSMAIGAGSSFLMLQAAMFLIRRKWLL